MAVGNGIPYMGYDSALGMAEETTFGTFITGTAFLEFNTESFKFIREELKLESINTQRGFTRRLMGKDTASGSLESYLNLAGTPLMMILKQAMGGTVATAAGSATSYTHTFNTGDMENNESTSGAADTKALSFSVRRGKATTDNNMWAYYGMRVNNLTLKGELGSPVVLTAEMIGKGASITTSLAAVSFSDVNPAHFYGVNIYVGDSITNATTEEFFQSFEVTLNNNLDGDQGSLGDREITVLPPRKRDVMLKLTQRFDTATAYNRFLGDTMTAIKIVIDSFQSISTDETTYSMIINLPGCHLNSVNPEVGSNDVLTQELEFSCMYNTETTYDINFVVVNATASI